MEELQEQIHNEDFKMHARLFYCPATRGMVHIYTGISIHYHLC